MGRGTYALSPNKHVHLMPIAAVHQDKAQKKQALRLPPAPTIANDKPIIKVTLIFTGFVQHRFHCLPVGRNETLVISCSLSCA